MNTTQPNRCHWGKGSYGSPLTEDRCTARKHPKRQLCNAHEALWKPIAKARRLARIEAEIEAARAAAAEPTVPESEAKTA